MKSASISIITVTYNAEKYIENTLISLVNQDYQNKELIVIDGASKDTTMKIVEKYMPALSVVISEPDKGLYDAMNKGIAKATGDYILFINAGDALHENSTLTKCLTHCPKADVIYGDTLLTDTQWKVIGKRRLRPPKKLIFRDFSKGMLVSHQAFIARRTLIPKFNLNYRYSSDFDWCVKILKKSAVICNVQIPVAHFMIGGQTSKTIIPGLFERFRIMHAHYGLVKTLWSHIFIFFRLFTSKF